MEMPINDRAVIGNNSYLYEHSLRADIETVLCDDHEKLFHFAKWHIDDYIQGTEGMQLETEGAYIRFLMRLYRRGKPLPDDDRFMSIAMGLSIRVWRRIRDNLVAIGKIICRSGYLTNSRFEKERRARAEQLRKQAEGAHKRWASQRSKAEVPLKFAETFAEVLPKLQETDAKKVNEINDATDSQPHILNIVVEREKDSKKEVSSNEQARLDAPKTKRSRSSVPDQYPHDFEEFWKVYPRREGKGDACKAWQRLTMPQKRKAYVALKSQLPALEAKRRDPRGDFCPHASTWINQGRFDDDPDAIKVGRSAEKISTPVEKTDWQKRKDQENAALDYLMRRKSSG